MKVVKFCWLNNNRICNITCAAAHGTSKDGVIQEDTVKCRLLSTITKIGKLLEKIFI
jgi:hypothetical protein